MSGLFAGTPLERPVTCAVCEMPREACQCPRDGDGEVLLPADQTAIVRLEKRKKGKIVTTISGLDPQATDLEAILKKLKSVCGSGGTISDNTIEVQGDHREKVAGVLRESGYPTRSV
ncbi:MAG: translation initiation factor [Planctomycetes bacterium]|nr:translation initiation factor [Planctomycetota bacterium]